MMKIHLTKIVRDNRYLYFIDKAGDISRKPRKNAGIGDQAEVVTKVGLVREKGKLYFIDKDGDVAESPMARRGKSNTP